ncbi:MAG TPA: hypothetical protein DCE23_06755 [Firmicutes bacterium]|nr:hypothetical protein [Bacillota bacterium]
MYSNLSKDEKKDLRERFKKTNKGSNVLEPLNRLLVEGIFLIICAIIIVGATYIFHYKWWLYFTAAIIFIFGLFFLIAQHIIRIKNYNNYLNYINKNKSNRKNKLTKKK